MQSLLNAEEYRRIIGPDLWKRMDYIRRCGNNVAHGSRKLGRDEMCIRDRVDVIINTTYSGGFIMYKDIFESIRNEAEKRNLRERTIQLYCSCLSLIHI